MKQSFLFLAALLTASSINAQTDVDWARFNVFEKANTEITESPDVVFMGNSITEMWQGQEKEFFKEHNFVGRGISGQVSSQMLSRFRPDVIDLHPKAVIILCGINDIALNNGYITVPHIFDNIKSMAELAQANGIVPILCKVLPSDTIKWRKEVKPFPLIKELNALIEGYASEQGFPLVDYFTPMLGGESGIKAEYTFDGVHPLPAGFKVMEAAALPVIEKALKLSKKFSRRALR